MKKSLILVFFISLFLISCSNENEKAREKNNAEFEKSMKSLPKLRPISIPENSTGLYVGTLPCDDCKNHIMRLKLDSSGRALSEEYFIRSTIDTIKGSASYSDSADFITIKFDDRKRWLSFKKKNRTSLIYINSFGEPYSDESGEAYQLLRILNID